jgi:hypothetical protein
MNALLHPECPQAEADERRVVHSIFTNCTAAESNFITGIIGLFSDPKYLELAELLKSGGASIYFSKSGTPAVMLNVMPN